jgi:Arm DNA-binding domain
MEKINLTDRAVAKLVAPERGRLEVPDAKMPGLVIRVAPSGKKTWTVVWHKGRQTRRYAIAAYPAVSLATAREYRISQGPYPLEAIRRGLRRLPMLAPRE